MRRAFLLLLVVLLPLMASADAVEINGIWYNLISKGKNAEVTSNPNGGYSGIVGIPEAVIYNGVNYRVTSIGSSAFSNCGGLTSVNIPNSVTSIGSSAFSGCRGLTSITIPNSVTNIVSYTFSYCSGLTSVTIPESVISIGGLAFCGCTSLTSVAIPKSVISIGSRAFDGCTSLTSVHISDLAAWCNISFDTDYDGSDYANPLYEAHHLYLKGQEIKDLVIPNSVTSIGNQAFCGCNSLTSVTIPNSVTSIGNSTFRGCSGLTFINIPNSVTCIGSRAFCECSGLTSVTIPNGVTSIGDHAFAGCTNLTSIAIPEGVTSIGEWVFYGCSGLISVTISNSVTSIGGGAFYDCSGLTSIIIPNSVTSIGGSAFYDCSGLTSITIPNSVTSIGEYAFYKCSGLTSITIGRGVKNIYAFAFANCPELTDVYCYAENVPQFVYYGYPYSSMTLFEGSYIKYATLHVPASAKNEYRTTAPWSNFGTIISTEGDTPEPKKCATPTISYADAKLKFNCDTEDVSYTYEITDSDIKKGFDSEVHLSATYNITVYATKAGYENSEVATATLCWIDVEPQTEGIIDEDAIAEVKALPVLIQTQGGTITVQGAAEGANVSVYSVNGMLQGSAIANESITILNTSLQPGSIAVVKIGDRSVKVMMK